MSKIEMWWEREARGHFSRGIQEAAGAPDLELGGGIINA